MLSSLSNQANVWIFQANKQLTKDQINTIEKSLNKFVPEWAAHGVSLKADFEVAKNLFLIIGVDENHAQASGCSKDTLNRHIQSIGDLLEVDFFNRLNIAYVNEKESIEIVNMITFKDLVQKDVIRQNTMVFNNLISKKSELETDWEVKLSESWHANLMPIQ
ncbi:MAG: hypothetical protein AB8B74_08815 [Crocinitomicaceae bacterium]